MDPLYTKLGIKYQQVYSGLYHDMSLSVDNSRIICAFKDKTLSGFGRPVISIGPQKRLVKPFKTLYFNCEHLWYMDYLEGGALSDIGTFLIKDGIYPNPYYTQIIDVTKTEAILHSELRKSYKSLINKYTPIDIPVKDLHKIHSEVSGRETRPQRTWDIQQKMVDEGQAFCIGIKDAAALFLLSDDTCYYGVAATRGVDTHSIIWHGILKAKELGCEFMELGQQFFEGDEKLKSISKFKRGFGGNTIVRMEFKK